MLQCPKCKKTFSENYTFCDECRGKLIDVGPPTPIQPEYKIFDRIERSVFFRITRSYTWAILILAILGFVGAIIYLVSDIRPLIKRDTSVSSEEVKIILAAKKTGKGLLERETSTKRIYPELLARLDKEIYELIILLPKTDQEKIGVEKCGDGSKIESAAIQPRKKRCRHSEKLKAYYRNLMNPKGVKCSALSLI